MPRARKTTTLTGGQYAGDLVSNAGKREMGPQCGSLPRNARELAGLQERAKFCSIYHVERQENCPVVTAVQYVVGLWGYDAT